MAEYEVWVTETISQSSIYYVEASSPEEALQKARIGDTLGEVPMTNSAEVIAREVWNDEATLVEAK